MKKWIIFFVLCSTPMATLVLPFALAQPSPINENSWTEYIRTTRMPEAIGNAVLIDGTRPDLMTTEYAIEVDWGPKWAEGVGQALYYAKVTSRTPAVLILTKEGEDRNNDIKYVLRAITALPRGSKVWWYDCNERNWVAGMGP